MRCGYDLGRHEIMFFGSDGLKALCVSFVVVFVCLGLSYFLADVLGKTKECMSESWVQSCVLSFMRNIQSFKSSVCFFCCSFV